MNRIVLFGLTSFFGLVAVGLVGEPKSAKGFHGMFSFGGLSCHGWNRCYGCHGCSSCGGCWSCHGCYGSAWRSCSGCSGCYGCHSCSGCSCWSSCHGCSGWSSCHGCAGCHGCYGYEGALPAAPVPTESWTPATPAPAAPASPTPKSASLRISLPTDATLLVGDFNTQSAGSVRYFQSPPLVEGKTYAYELRAEMNKGGRVVTQTKTVVVTAGQNADVDLDLEETQVAQAWQR